jgi:hypothetical protein
MIRGVAINKVDDDPPIIDNTDQKTYTATAGEYASNITYLPCTIQPNEWTKIGTIVVTSDQHPANGSIGHWHMKDLPYLENLTAGGTGLPLYELVRTYNLTTAEEIDADSGATKRMDFDIMFKDYNSHELVGGEWPSNYDAVASRDDSIGVRLVVPRPFLFYDIISENVIEVIDLGDFGVTAADIAAGEVLEPVPNKVIETGSDPLIPIPLNPGNAFMPNAVGTINKVVEEAPNPITIQGTPGAQFQLEFVEGNFAGTSTNKSTGGSDDATGGKWATSEVVDGVTEVTPKTFTIPDSGKWVGALTNVPQIAATNDGKEFELKVTAVNSTISTSAGKPQSVGNINAIENNNAVYKFTQPCSDVNITIKLKATGHIAADSQPKAGEYGVVGNEHILVNINGFGTSSVDSASYQAFFTATIEGTGSYVGEEAVLTGDIELVKFPNTDLTLEFDWDTFLNRGTPWSSKNTPSDFISEGLSDTTPQAEVGATTWTTGAGTTGAELTISNVTLTINP